MHYDLIELRLYKEGLLDRELAERLEDHLFSCGECMDLYLGLIDGEEVARAGELIPEDFTGKVLMELEGLEKLRPLRPRKQSLARTMVHYSLAASIAIVLSLAGFFGKPYELAKLNKDLDPAYVKGFYQGSEKIADQFSNLFNKEFRDFKDVKDKDDINKRRD